MNALNIGKRIAENKVFKISKFNSIMYISVINETVGIETKNLNIKNMIEINRAMRIY